MALYKKVSVDALYVDERYQRPIDERRVKRIVQNFDPAMVGTLEVSQRNGSGSYAVFDGQHRLVAAREAGIDTLPCLVHKGMSPEQEAMLFLSLQRERKTVSAVERFHARVFCGDETARTILAIVEKAGFTIGERHSNPGQIRAILSLERINKRGNLAETLAMTAALWSGDAKSTDGALLEGLSTVLDGYGHRMEPGSPAFERLQATSPVVMLRRAIGMGGGGGDALGRLVANEIRKVASLQGAPRTRKTPA